MNEQLLKDFIATAQKYNYNWNTVFGKFPELKGYDQQLLKDYVATAEKYNYDYGVVNSKFPELGFKQEPLKKKESTELASKSEKPTSASSSRRFEGVTEEPISQKKVRTEDYIDQVQNANKKQTETKVANPFAQKPTEKTVDVLTTKEANKMMAEDFGKKEFAAYSSINKMPSTNALNDLDDETTADILNKQFEGTNLEFKKIGSQLTVTSKLVDDIIGSSKILNEKTIDLSEPDADKELKSFISTNILKKSEREQFENVQSVEDLVKLVGSNPNKFSASLLEDMDVDSYFEEQGNLLSDEMARAKADTYDSDLKSYEQKVIKFNQDVKSGKMTKADFDARSAELDNERNSLENRRNIISNVIYKSEKIDKLLSNLEEANVITAEEKEKQGSRIGLFFRGVGGGFVDVPQTMIDFGIAGAAAVMDAKTLADAIKPGEYERLKNLGFSDDKIKNEIQKSVKNRANKVLKSVPDAFSMGTTEEYVKSADRGIIDQAIYAVGESLGAVGGGIGVAPLGAAGTTAGFFAMSYNALEDQMRGPQFDALSENEKKIMSVPYGLVIGALERLGAKVAVGAAKNKTLGMFSEYIIAKTFSSIPKDASLLEIKSAINKSVAASVANGMLKITGAGVVEGGTEFTQQIFEGIEKDVANRIIQSNQLETAKEEGGGTVSKEIYNQIVQNKFFKNAADLSTTEGIGQLLKESGNAFLVGAVAGGMGSTASVGVIEPISNKVSNNRFAIYRDIILNDEAREGAISSINKKVENNELTREQADEQIASINEAYPALRQIPTDFSVGAQREAFGLLMERERLNQEIKDKDPNLVAKQKERVAEINEQLKGISYAVQEQATGEVSVQPTTGVGTEMEEGVSETKPEGVTGETITEEVKVEEPKAEQPQANLTKEEIEARRKETEAKIKRKDLFDGVGEFSSTLGNSDKAAVPFSHREKNGIEVVEFAHPDTGSIDVIITGTSNNDFVGFYRIYENGKPTNRWSSKFENQSRNKENFKTMIGSVQELLPAGHEYTEKTSISTDGLRVWNQQLDRGYELQYDENGNLVTNEVAINGDAIVNELGIDVERGRFSNINVRSQAEFEKVKQALLPYLQKFGLNESNIRWMSGPLKDSGTVKIDLPVLKKSTSQETGQPEVQETAAAEKLTVNPSEGYSFEYESENDIPAELKGVEPTGRTETKVGRGKNAKTKLKLTFTGQQLIDAGLAVTPEAQAEVVQPEVQAEVQAEPTAKIESIEVEEVPQVEQSLNDLTQQNNVLTENDFTAARIRNVGKEKVVAQIQKAAKAIAKVLPKVKIVVHATPEAFVEATKDMDGRLSEGGLYDQQTGQIHINLERANNRTVAHEVFHALILSMVKSDVEAQRLTRSMIKSVIKSLKKAEGTAELISYLEEFESNYDNNIKDEEKLGELFGILADNYKALPPASKNIIIRFLNRLAKALGLKEMTDREAIQFMNTLSRKVETGQEIEVSEVGKQKEGKAAVRKQIIGEVGAKRLDQQENSTLRMDNLQVAKDMKDEGKTPKQIRNATGWEMGAEGKWRYETVDNLPFFNDVVNKVRDLIDNKLSQYPLLGISDKAIVSEKASDIIPSELTKMYPELNDYTIDFGIENENKGKIDVDDKKIRVNVGQNPINTVKVLLHEVQHAIQEIEGFDSGTSAQKIIDEFIAQDNAFKNRINRIKKYSPNSPLLDSVRNQRKDFIDNFSTVNKNNEKILNGVNLYLRKAGEIEARNVEARMNMTEEQRRNTLLTETEDVKDRQIIETAPRKFAVRKQKGLINLTDQEAMKYARAGVENKYDAQAIKQIGLQGTKFDKQSILERIQKEFDGLVKNTTDYIFREDSPAIDQAIQNEIDTMVDQGYSNDQIERAKRALKPGPERDNFINSYRRAQVETANQWESYLGQSDYPASFKYLMLDAVLTNNYDLKTDRYQKRTGKTIRNFTPFDAGTLAELYMSDSNELLKDYVRIQADNSANIVESAAFSSTKDGKWIKFDGGGNVGEQELKDNANKLSQLVQNTYWCTKTNALSQLRDGDFYVYVTENKQGDFDPRIAVRMDGDKVGEVRGNASSKQDLEADMLPVADTFLREKIPNDSGKKWLDSIAYNTKVKDLTEKIDTKVLDMDDVNEYIDIIKDKDKFSVDYGENGLVQKLQDKFRDAKFSFGVADSQTDIKDDTLLLIAPNDIYTFMFYNNEQTKNVQVIIGNVNIYSDFDGGKVKAITGNVVFEDSSIKEIKSIESIGGNVRFRNSEIKYLGSLKEIGGDVSFRNSEIRYLGNLKSIGGQAIFRDSEVISLENLEFIGGNADFYDSNLEDLGSLKEIGGNADFVFSSIESLDGLKKIGGEAKFEDSGVKDLGELTEVGGTVNVNNSKIKSLGKLKKARNLFSNSNSKLNDLGELTEIVSNLNLYNNDTLKSLGKLKKIGGRAFFVNSKVEDLGALESIGGTAEFQGTNIKSLGKIKEIGGTADLSDSKIEDLGELESIGSNAYFQRSNIKSLGNLKSIGKDANFKDSNIKSLGNLESIGRDADFYNSKVEDLGNLQFIGGAVGFQGKPELKEQWQQRQERQFAVRKQKTTGPNRIVENGVKAGKTDAEIRQEGRAAGFTNKEMTEALSKYYTKEQGIFMKSGIKGKVGQFVDFAKKWKQKYLTTKGLLAKVGFTYKEKMEGEISAEANRAAKTAKKFGVLFDKFTGDKELLKDAFDKVLRGDKAIQLPAGFAALANEMRNHIDRLSEMLIATGAVDADMADTIRKNIGSYITRSYEIYDNKNFRQKVGEQELQAAKNFLRTQPGMLELAKAEAARTDVTVDEALDVLVDNKIDEYFADAETGALVKGSRLGSKDLSTLKERKEIPEQIRMLMGEYSDPAMNYARTVLNIATLAARHQFLTQVKEAGMGKFFFEKNDSQRPKGFDTEIASEGSDTMSPLNGLMTTPEIAEAFGLYDGQKGKDNWYSQLSRIYYKAMALVKWLKTIASVGTHMKNVFSNFGFVGVNGHSLIEIGKAAKVVAQDLKTMSKPEVEAKIDEYIKAGIMRQGAGINEIRDMFKDADMDGFLERRLSMRKPKGVMGKIKQVISSRSSKIISFAEDLYQAEDDMFKIAAYETEMNRYADALYNKSKDQLTDKERQEVSDIAANNVKNTYPTYSRIPEGIKQLRKFPLFIGSFISFQAESYRTAYNTIGLAKDELSSDNEKIRKIGVRRIAGAFAYLTAKTALLSYAGYAAGTGLSGVLGALFNDDDEEEKEKDVRSFLPPWSKNSDLIILKAADGEIEYIDFSASDPHGGINKALNALFSGEDMLDSFKQSTLELVGQFQGPDILTNLAIQLKNNENDFGKPIYNEEDAFQEKTAKILDYVYKVVEPGTITSVRKGVFSEQSLGQLAFGEATGLKIRKVDVKDQFGYKLPEFDESFKDIRKIYNSEYYKSVEMYEDPKATEKDIEEQNKKTDEAFIRANEKYAAKAKELMDLINSANRLGVDYDDLINELSFIKSTMGKSNISEMENGGNEFIKEKDY